MTIYHMIYWLQIYGLDLGSLNFQLDYLSLGKHRATVGSSYSQWSKFFCRGIPQGSILGSLSFNMFIKNVFFRRKIRNLSFLWWEYYIFMSKQILFTSEVFLYWTIFLLKLNPAIEFSNLKPKLKIWEILIVDL